MVKNSSKIKKEEEQNNESYILGNTIAIMGTSFAALLIIFALVFWFIIRFDIFWIGISAFLCSQVITILYYINFRRKTVKTIS